VLLSIEAPVGNRRSSPADGQSQQEQLLAQFAVQPDAEELLFVKERPACGKTDDLRKAESEPEIYEL
jgi:hypothetical protein